MVPSLQPPSSLPHFLGHFQHHSHHNDHFSFIGVWARRHLPPLPSPPKVIFSKISTKTTTSHSPVFGPRYISYPCPLVLIIEVWAHRHLLPFPLNTNHQNLGPKTSLALVPQYRSSRFGLGDTSCPLPSTLFIGVWSG